MERPEPIRVAVNLMYIGAGLAGVGRLHWRGTNTEDVGHQPTNPNRKLIS